MEHELVPLVKVFKTYTVYMYDVRNTRLVSPNVLCIGLHRINCHAMPDHTLLEMSRANDFPFSLETEAEFGV